MSQIITHDWNGFGISQLKKEAKIAKRDVPRGYVNATQMCQANGKLWGHYAARKSSKAYWKGLADDIWIPISSLIVQVDGYGDEQATWVHPEVAVDLAQWVSVPFKIWANRTLTGVVSVSNTDGEVVKSVDPVSLMAELNIAEQLLIELGVDTTVIKQLKVDNAISCLPNAKQMLEAGKKYISAADPVDTVGMNATQVGEHLNPIKDAKEVNELLETMGLQYKMYCTSAKTGKQKWTWQVTEEGEKYSHVHKVSNSQNGWNGGQIKWQKSVAKLIQEYLDSKAA